MRLLLEVFSVLLLMAAIAQGQQIQPYDGLRASQDAHEQAEAQRQLRFNDQLYLNDAMRARYGWPLSGNVVWYGNAGSGYTPPVGADYAYAHSSDRWFGRRGRTLYFDRYWSPPVAVFEPWPYIPGDIYGYYFPPYVRQPIGQRQIQTGPNRWESHPVYRDEAATPDATPGESAPIERATEPAAEPAPAAEIDAPPPAPPVDDDPEPKPAATKKRRRYYF